MSTSRAPHPEHPDPRSRWRPRHRAPAALAVALTVALASLLTGAPAAAQPGAAGSLVLVGGGLSDDNAAVYGEIVRRAGGADARIGVVTASSVPPSQDPDAGTPEAANSETNGTFYADILERYGAGEAEWIPIDLDRIEAADDPDLAALVGTYTGFFFGGGDQYRYVRTLTRGSAQEDSAVLAAVRARFAAGAVVAGTSAGAQIQAGPDMVTGGQSYDAVRDGAGTDLDADGLTYLPQGGFGFFRSGLLDTHFAAWGRQGRAIRLAADTGNDRVFGIDPDTALVVDAAGTPGEQLSVLGADRVSVLDLRAAEVYRYRGEWAIDGVRWSELTGGDRYDPASWQVRPAAGTRPLVPADRSAVAPREDVFSSPDGDGGEFVMSRLAADLLEAGRTSRDTGRTHERSPEFAVTLTEGPATTARTRDGSSAVAFTDLVVRIERS